MTAPAVGTIGVKGADTVVCWDGSRWAPVSPAKRYALRMQWSRDTRWVRQHCAVLWAGVA